MVGDDHRRTASRDSREIGRGDVAADLQADDGALEELRTNGALDGTVSPLQRGKAADSVDRRRSQPATRRQAAIQNSGDGEHFGRDLLIVSHAHA